MTTFLAVVLDSSAVLALGLVVCRLLASRSAALRHAVLTAALVAAAAAPVLELTLPNWEIPILSTSSDATSSGVTLSSNGPVTVLAAQVQRSSASEITWTEALTAAWGVGSAIVMFGLLAGIGRLAWMTRRCRPVSSGSWHEQAAALSSQHGLKPPVILRSVDRALLLTWGYFRPRIIVPAAAASWSEERIHVVLAHELAHIRRRDWVVQIGAEALRAAYWFNPLVWIVCRRLRDESEQACDDAVLRRGVEAADYASHLLAVARHVVAEGRGWATAPAIANPSTLERRIASMLNASRNLEPLRRGLGAITLLAMLAIAAPLAALTLTERVEAPVTPTTAAEDVALAAPQVSELKTPVPAAAAAVSQRPIPRAAARSFADVPAASQQAQAPATIIGTISDASGGVLPGVSVVLTESTGNRRNGVTDAAGRFAFANLQPARYELVASLPGFATILNQVTLAPGENAQLRLNMRIGMVEESIQVACAAGGAAVPRADRILALEKRPPATRLFTVPRAEAQDQTAQLPIRVGGQIKAPRKVRDMWPVCPRLLLPSLTTTVRLEATIGADGATRDIRLTGAPGTAPPQEFVDSAIQAVQQWQFTPTLLNNVPVPVIMSVTIEYRRM